MMRNLVTNGIYFLDLVDTLRGDPLLQKRFRDEPDHVLQQKGVKEEFALVIVTTLTTNRLTASPKKSWWY